MRDAKPLKQRFGEVKQRLQQDSEWVLLRVWCNLWKLPPNDPRILDYPISEIESWLVANGIERWLAEDDSHTLAAATAEDVYPDNNEDFKQIYTRVLEQMGGSKADPDAVVEEARRIWRKRHGDAARVFL